MSRAPVTFGIGSFSTQSTYVRPRRHPYLFREAVAEARRAEELGFDCLWVGEHHFSYDGYTPSLLPVLAHVAAGTERLALATGMLLFPLHSADEIARQCDAFHSAAPGRTLRLGVAVGYVAKEFLGHRIAFAERGSIIESQLDELLSHHEELGDTELWMGGNSNRAFRRAARYGASLLLTANVGPDEVRAIRAAWESELVPRAHAPRIAIQREVWVHDDDRSGAFFRERLRESWRTYELFTRAATTAEAGWSRADDDAAPFLDAMAGLAVIGSASEVAEHLAQLIAAGVDELYFRVRIDGTSHGQVLENLERIAADVMPQLRSL